MLVFRQIEPDFDQCGAFLHQMILEIPDRPVPVIPVIAFRRMHRPDPLGNDRLVVTAIERHHLAETRQEGRHPPEKIVPDFGALGPAERPGVEAGRIGVGRQGADQAVLATGIRAEDDQQYRPGPVGPQPALVFTNLAQTGFQPGQGLVVIIQLGRVIPEPGLLRVEQEGTGKCR